MQKVRQYVSMPPWPLGLTGKNVKSRISHQCWRGWRCDNTSKYFNFLRIWTLMINDIGIFSPIEMKILQLKISQTSPSKEGYILKKICKFTRFWIYRFNKRCLKCFDLPLLLLEQHLYCFYIFILCIHQFNHLSYYGKSRNTSPRKPLFERETCNSWSCGQYITKGLQIPTSFILGCLLLKK